MRAHTHMQTQLDLFVRSAADRAINFQALETALELSSLKPSQDMSIIIMIGVAEISPGQVRGDLHCYIARSSARRSSQLVFSCACCTCEEEQ